MKILTILGARPQFIKAAPVSHTLDEAGIEEVIIHTGQHYDPEMSENIINELGLKITETLNGRGMPDMIRGIETEITKHKPSAILLYGDTDSTMAGAVVGCKYPMPMVHIEAGLRSFNKFMPEEHNRVAADHLSDVLMCPTVRAVHNLAHEGLVEHVALVGDTMLDAAMKYSDKGSGLPDKIQGEYYLATVHRPVNTDNSETLHRIAKTFDSLDKPVAWPMHPRIKGKVDPLFSNIRYMEPVGYFDMLKLIKNAHAVITDSGGVQKEAYFLKVPCITLRDETEWTETVESGWNTLSGTDHDEIINAVENITVPQKHPAYFGDGKAAERIVNILRSI